MTRPLPHMKPDVSQFREYIAELAYLARIHTDLIERYAEIGDDTGLEYAMRNFVAVARNSAAAMRDLKSWKVEHCIAQLNARADQQREPSDA